MNAQSIELVSDADYEQLTLNYWLARCPDLSDVTVIVRRDGRAVRTVLLEPPTPPASSCAPPRLAPVA